MPRINSRQKGKLGELELAKMLTAYGHPAKRGQQFQGSPDSPDIICPSLSSYHIEAKRTEHLSLYKALEQATRDAGDSKRPLVIHRANKQPWVVVMLLDDFMELLK